MNILDILKKALVLLSDTLDVIMPPKKQPVRVWEIQPAPVQQGPSLDSDRDKMAPEVLLWDTPQHAWHAVRVMCDRAGMSRTQKDTLCACVYQESQFYNYLPSGIPAKGINRRPDGSIASTDWGIVQINDHYHIGPGKDFPSVQYVLDHPEKAVGYMIAMMLAGKLSLWSSFKGGAYRRWLPLTSPMWKLAVK